MKNSEIDKIVSDLVSSKINEIKALQAEELRSLPSYTPIKFEVGGKVQELGVYHETLDDGNSLFVAQCKNTRFLGMGNMYAEGFVLSVSGKVSPAPEELMWEFT